MCLASLSNPLRINNPRVGRLRLQFGHTQGFALRMSRLSDLAGGVTGEIHYVDAGYNKVGMPDPKNIT